MKKIKKYLSLILCVTMVVNFTLPNFATNENHFESSGTDYTTTSAFDANENDVIVEEEQTEAEEDVDKNDYENISTPSDAATFEESEDLVATDSDVIIEKNNDYAKLTAVEQFNYIVDDSAKYEDGIITLLKDVELYDTIRFTDDTTLDLNGFNIIGPENNYTLYVENNFTITDSSVKQKENNANDNTNNDANNNIESNQDINQDNNQVNEIEIKSSIKSTNHNFPVIYAKNAKLNIGTTQILAADGIHGGDAIHLFNSDLTIDGAIIKAGNGADVNDDKGGNGGMAINIHHILTDLRVLKIYQIDNLIKHL